MEICAHKEVVVKGKVGVVTCKFLEEVENEKVEEIYDRVEGVMVMEVVTCSVVVDVLHTFVVGVKNKYKASWQEH